MVRCGIHNPKSVCMENGVHSKGYPKKFNSETKLSVNGYPEYRRCNDGCKVLKHGIVMDNRYAHTYDFTHIILIHTQECGTI